jgi:hypothetical protein
VSIHTSSRARVREDRAGDPLDGLVNLFDLGIVLSVAFLLAALTALKLTGALLHHTPVSRSHGAIRVGPRQTARKLHLRSHQRIAGYGKPVGRVYRLKDGQLVYITGAKHGGG